MTTVIYRRVNVGSTARAFALCLLALAAALLLPGEVQAQWTAPDAAGNISTTNTGNVGVGSAAPTSRLEVRGATSDANGNAFGVTNSSGQGLFTVRNDGMAVISPPAGTRGGLTIYSDGNQWNYSDFNMVPATSTSIATGKPLRFGFSLMKNNPTYGGDSSGPSFVLSATIQGGGTYVPLIVNPNGNVILAGASNAVNGNVGVGTAAPSFKFEVAGSTSRNTLALTGDGDVAGYAGIKIQALTTTGIAANRSSQFNLHMRKDSWYSGDGSGPSFIIETVSTAGGFAAPFMITPTNNVILNGGRGASGLSYGNVGIGTTTPVSKLHVAGDITVDGNINAKYQDVAEWVPSKQKLNAGTVVILDVERDNHVAASATAYDTRVAGVISAQPGISLGEKGEGKVLVATTGRVKVRVDATRGAIKVGDLLVTSEVAGVAMKSQPLDLGGVPIHRPGTLIGKALESLEKGTGEILVLLSLQ